MWTESSGHHFIGQFAPGCARSGSGLHPLFGGTVDNLEIRKERGPQAALFGEPALAFEAKGPCPAGVLRWGSQS